MFDWLMALYAGHNWIGFFGEMFMVTVVGPIVFVALVAESIVNRNKCCPHCGSRNITKMQETIKNIYVEYWYTCWSCYKRFDIDKVADVRSWKKIRKAPGLDEVLPENRGEKPELDEHGIPWLR
jgi:DNA-directed RNA polymerase subunit RPC12/RpoP